MSETRIEKAAWRVVEALAELLEVVAAERTGHEARTTRWLRPGQAAKVVGVDPRTISEWARTGRVPARRVKSSGRYGWRWEVDADVIERIAAERGVGGNVPEMRRVAVPARGSTRVVRVS